VFTRPDGHRIPECGSRPTVAAASTATNPVPAYFRGNAEVRPLMGGAGLAQFNEIDASTARCKWLGERMDYSTAIEGMQDRERGVLVNGERVFREGCGPPAA
jgi:hypothetical protein